MTPIVQVDHVTRRYRGMTALDDVSTALQADTITGLLGRNGAGQVHPDADHHRPGIRHLRHRSGSAARIRWRTTSVLRRMIFVKESQIYPDIKVKRALEAASWFYPNWDAELAGQLMERFRTCPTNGPSRSCPGA